MKLQSVGRIFGGTKALLNKNVGKNWAKGAGGVYKPHQGPREMERRRKRLEQQEKKQ